ncbi:hypothetical protein SCHPADRAFT_948217, partial [Schizopora paradoxa]
LNWLQQHNPAIDWVKGQLALSCCGVNPLYPHSPIPPLVGTGHGLIHLQTTPSPSLASVGMGFCLNGAVLETSVPDSHVRSAPLRTNS